MHPSPIAIADARDGLANVFADLIGLVLQAATVKAALLCLGRVTSFLNPGEWSSTVRPFGLLLKYAIDTRPKIRRHAQVGLVEVLAAVQGTAAHAPASETILRGAFPSSFKERLRTDCCNMQCLYVIGLHVFRAVL